MPAHVLVDIQGTCLTSEDREVLSHPAVVGVILFARNFESRAQLFALCKEIRKLRSGIISVDQEGGRVQRFREGFTLLPPMSHWGQQYRVEPEATIKSFIRMTHCMVHELMDCGVNVCLAPVLDLDLGRNDVISERSFGNDPKLVAKLAAVMVRAMYQEGMLAVGKHFPGHGGTYLDSHHHLPVDDRKFATLWQQDLQPFLSLSRVLPAMMSVHVLFPELDSMPATFSRFWLTDVLRDKMRFEGMLISDCLSMKAVEGYGSYAERARLALGAGNDVLLVCNNRQGAIEVLDEVEGYHHEATDYRVAKYINYLQ